MIRDETAFLARTLHLRKGTVASLVSGWRVCHPMRRSRTCASLLSVVGFGNNLLQVVSVVFREWNMHSGRFLVSWRWMRGAQARSRWTLAFGQELAGRSTQASTLGRIRPPFPIEYGIPRKHYRASRRAGFTEVESGGNQPFCVTRVLRRPMRRMASARTSSSRIHARRAHPFSFPLCAASSLRRVHQPQGSWLVWTRRVTRISREAPSSSGRPLSSRARCRAHEWLAANERRTPQRAAYAPCHLVI